MIGAAVNTTSFLFHCASGGGTCLYPEFYSSHPRYDGRPIVCEFSPVTDFREARCRQYDEATCGRGGQVCGVRAEPLDFKSIVFVLFSVPICILCLLTPATPFITSATLCMCAICHLVLCTGVRGRPCMVGGNVSIVVGN